MRSYAPRRALGSDGHSTEYLQASAAAVAVGGGARTPVCQLIRWAATTAIAGSVDLHGISVRSIVPEPELGGVLCKLGRKEQERTT